MKRNLAPQGLALARRMREQGVLLDIPEDDSETGRREASGLHISQNGISSIMPINPVLSAYIFDLRVVSNFSSPFQISEVGVEFPWWEVRLDWLPEPDETDVRGVGYRFPSDNPLEFERKGVINPYVGSDRKLPRGVSVSGLLLGTGEQIPKDAGPNPAPTVLYVYDQFEQKFEAQLLVFLERSKLRTDHRKRRRKPLLECRDPENPTMKS